MTPESVDLDSALFLCYTALINNFPEPFSRGIFRETRHLQFVLITAVISASQLSKLVHFGQVT
jgi:hypothetical protein